MKPEHIALMNKGLARIRRAGGSERAAESYRRGFVVTDSKLAAAKQKTKERK